MIDVFALAKKALKIATEVVAQHKDESLGEAVIANALIQAHKEGYNAAKEFYLNKAPGWGTTKDAVERMATEYQKTIFGLSVDVPTAEGHNIIILMEQTNSGLKPLRILLPHQIYLEDLVPGKEYVILPGSSSDYVTLNEKTVKHSFGKGEADES